ncbi:unnamed protein product [Linum tenue]|uniref:ATP-dependent RNA helicase n=1 Tax=Linum tenue TaxID=586396 RepID=A0AAV0JSY9_9ROSI|nr:unnamed protein product [Linum tenue]
MPPNLRFSSNYAGPLPSSQQLQRRRHHEFIAVQPGDKDDHRLSRRGVRSLATAAAVSTAANRGGVETFFADEGVSWTALGLSDTISQALSSAGFNRQSLVQAESIPSILSGKDSIIAAETGSGKTHSYLVPLIHKLSASSGGAVSGSASDKGFKPSREVSLVLCPNVLLCEQVVRMANGLRDDNGDPLIKVAAVCGRQGWPVYQPDILVSTPAAPTSCCSGLFVSGC